LAAYTQGYTDTVGVEESWVSDRVEFRVTNRFENLPFVFVDAEEGSY
jgi:hypothetical protein